MGSIFDKGLDAAKAAVSATPLGALGRLLLERYMSGSKPSVTTSETFMVPEAIKPKMKVAPKQKPAFNWSKNPKRIDI